MAAKASQNVSLTPELQRLIRGAIASGHYANVSEVVRAGLRLLFGGAATKHDQTAGPEGAWTQQQLAALFAQSTAGLAQVDLTGRFVWVNDRYCTIVGRSREELLQLRMQEITHPDDRPSNAATFAESGSKGQAFQAEKRYVRPDGSPVWVSNSVSPVLNAAGETESMLAVCIEITRRKLAETALQESEARFRLFSEETREGVVLHDGQTILDCNRAYARMFGYDGVEDVVGRSIHETVALDSVPLVRRKIEERSEEPFEIVSLRKDGSMLPCEIVAREGQWRGQRVRIVLARDLTQAKLREAELRESEERFRSVFEQAAVGIERVSLEDGRLLDANSKLCAMLGYDRDELLTRTFAEITHPDDLGAERPLVEKLRSGELTHYSFEKRYLRNSGQVIWVRVTSSLARVAAGKDYRVSVIEDITDRRQTEQDLQAALDAGSLAIYDYDHVTGTIRPSPHLNDLYGYPADHPITIEDIRVRYHPEDVDEIFGKIRRRNEDPGIHHFDWTTRLLLPDGRARWVNGRGEYIRDETGWPVRSRGVVMDITDRKRWEEHQQLLINELNHRVKNTLATVQSITTQTLRNAGAAADARDAIEGRLMALSRAHDVLTRESWEAASLTEIVSQATAPYRSKDEARFHCDGPDVRLPPRIALALAMALQELATNAVKYGALSNATGRVDLTWEIDNADEGSRLKLRWVEVGGPPVKLPTRRGFGSRLIERSLAQDLDGTALLEFAPSGLVCTLDAPLLAPQERDPAAA